MTHTLTHRHDFQLKTSVYVCVITIAHCLNVDGYCNSHIAILYVMHMTNVVNQLISVLNAVM